MAKHTEILLPPTNYTTDEDHIIYGLNPLDRVQADVYIPWLLCYRLVGDPNDAIGIIKKSLYTTLGQYPILTGDLALDESTGNACVIRRELGGTPFTIHQLPSSFPTFAELLASNFPPGLLDPELLLPSSTATPSGQAINSRSESCTEIHKPVAAFQINILDGGLIIALSIHHFLTDGAGMDAFLCEWCANGRNLSAGFPKVASFDPATLDRSPLAIKDHLLEKSISQLLESFPQYRIADYVLYPPPNRDLSFETAIFHISDDKLSALKGITNTPKLSCTPSETNSTTPVTSNDLIIALFWCCITRARQRDRPNIAGDSILSSAVQFRGESQHGLPDGYFGNSYIFALAKTSFQQLLDIREGVSRAACTVRASVNKADDEQVEGTLALVGRIEDIKRLKPNFHFYLGPDVATTSFKRLRLYQDANFGFGVPERLRFPKVPVDGLVCVHPQRFPGDGYEVTVCLESRAMHRLRLDSQLTSYFTLRGL